MQIKLYTVDEAERTLPLVKRIVGDIVQTFEAREKQIVELQKLGPNPTPGSNSEEQAFALQNDIDSKAEEIGRFHQELEKIGVELKDVRVGLIDFFSRYDNKVVYLCWRLDEGPTLAWWHDLNGGFRGRKPITPQNRARFHGLPPGVKYLELS